MTDDPSVTMAFGAQFLMIPDRARPGDTARAADEPRKPGLKIPGIFLQ
jgi:hypothetical protein